MAITEERPLELGPAETVERREPLGVFKRPTSDTGWRSWITAQDTTVRTEAAA